MATSTGERPVSGCHCAVLARDTNRLEFAGAIDPAVGQRLAAALP